MSSSYKNEEGATTMIRYKLTDEFGKTYSNTQWSVGITVRAKGKGNEPCSTGVLHHYKSAVDALAYNKKHADFKSPRLWEIEIDKELGFDGKKGWCKSQTVVRELEWTTEIYLAAVKQNGWALQFVPMELRTPEICLAAIKQNGWALQFVPMELCSSEICLLAVKQNGSVLEYVPTKLRSLEICLEAVKHSGWTLLYVPTELRSSEVCLAAVNNDGLALQYVPTELRIALGLE